MIIHFFAPLTTTLCVHFYDHLTKINAVVKIDVTPNSQCTKIKTKNRRI